MNNAIEHSIKTLFIGVTCVYCIQHPKRFYLIIMVLLIAYNTILPIRLENTPEIVEYALYPYNITHITLPSKHFYYVRESDPFTYIRTPYWHYFIKQRQVSIIVLASSKMLSTQQLGYFINHSPIEAIYTPNSKKPCDFTETDANHHITCFTITHQCRCIALINNYGYILSPYETYSTHQV